MEGTILFQHLMRTCNLLTTLLGAEDRGRNQTLSLIKMKKNKGNVELVNVKLCVGWRWVAEGGHTGYWQRGGIFFFQKVVIPGLGCFQHGVKRCFVKVLRSSLSNSELCLLLMAASLVFHCLEKQMILDE